MQFPGNFSSCFFAYACQSWYTDEVTGEPSSVVSEGLDCFGERVLPRVMVAAALVSPSRRENSREKVALFNCCDRVIPVNDWFIEDCEGRREPIHEPFISPGQLLIVALNNRRTCLPGSGGTISLFDDKGVKIHGVSYVADNVDRESRWVSF